MPGLPTGTVTFLFTDIEGSTSLLESLGDRQYAEILAEHQRILRAAFAATKGHEIDTQGDAFFVVFQRATDAVTAAIAAQRAITTHSWPDAAAIRVRMGLHTGAPTNTASRYIGLDVHRAARICAAGHGGQILLSVATRSLVENDLPAGTSLRDLGSHRLKDLHEPEKIFQLIQPDLIENFPPLQSLDAFANNLPRQLTGFVGRELEMAEVRRLLSASSLVTLTGTGGAGKTRLAVQIAADVLEVYADGVWLVELAAVADPTRIPQTVASALGVREVPGRPILATLLDYIRHKRLLLVLDNCEHLRRACAQLAGALLRTSSTLRILATSRETLGVPGEVARRVPSLSLPDPSHLPPLEDLAQNEAVRLFIERAVAVQPLFTLTHENAVSVAALCHRLDGIPLAIELAAARAKVLTVKQIAERLDDRFQLLTAGSRAVLPRHQTLRASMDWSYDLLSEMERALLRRQSVFAGGWTLEAAEAVCSGDPVKVAEALDLLTQLVDKSLVVAETQGKEARYRILETVRQYGWDRLLESGEADKVQRQHRNCYLGLAERAEPQLLGADQAAWFDRLEVEHDNLRAALEWSLKHEGIEVALRLAGALWRFWFVRGYWEEGRGWLKATLEKSNDLPAVLETTAPTAAGDFATGQTDFAAGGARSKQSQALWRSIRGFWTKGRREHEKTLVARPDAASSDHACAVLGEAFLAWRQGDYGAATALGERALQAYRNLGDKRGIALSLHAMGTAARQRGEYTAAAELVNKALIVAREADDQLAIGLSVGLAAMVARHQGNYARAGAFFEESVAMLRAIEDKWDLARVLVESGHAAQEAGQAKQALQAYEEGLVLFREIRDRRGIAFSELGMGRVAATSGDFTRARDLGVESLALFLRLGDQSGIAYAKFHLGSVAASQGDAGLAITLLQESLALHRRLGQSDQILRTLEGLAAVLLRGQPAKAVRLLAAAQRLTKNGSFPGPTALRTSYERSVTAARLILAEQAFASAWAEGRAMTLDQAVDYALQPRE